MVLAAFLLAANVAFAELPPYVYIERQKKAPEALTIRVLSVRTRETDGEQFKTIAVTVRARVLKVQRTATKLRRNSEIEIQYVHREHKVPIAGPSEVPILDRGREYPAFLVKDGKARSYSPAAGGWTFARAE